MSAAMYHITAWLVILTAAGTLGEIWDFFVGWRCTR